MNWAARYLVKQAYSAAGIRPLGQRVGGVLGGAPQAAQRFTGPGVSVSPGSIGNVQQAGTPGVLSATGRPQIAYRNPNLDTSVKGFLGDNLMNLVFGGMMVPGMVGDLKNLYGKVTGRGAQTAAQTAARGAGTTAARTAGTTAARTAGTTAARTAGTAAARGAGTTAARAGGGRLAGLVTRYLPRLAASGPLAGGVLGTAALVGGATYLGQRQQNAYQEDLIRRGILKRGPKGQLIAVR
jgi:hypothetical protein